MQIDPDISPAISPKSNVSNSFASQKDMFLFSLNSNRNIRQSSENPTLDIQTFKEDNPNRAINEPNSANPNNQNNTITTNESFSVEKHSYLEIPTTDNPNNSFNGILVPEISIEKDPQYDEDQNKSQLQTLHILEYEEFSPNKEILSPSLKSPVQNVTREKSTKDEEKAVSQKPLEEVKPHVIEQGKELVSERNKSNKSQGSESITDQSPFSNLLGSSGLPKDRAAIQNQKKKEEIFNLKNIVISDEEPSQRTEQTETATATEKGNTFEKDFSLTKESTIRLEDQEDNKKAAIKSPHRKEEGQEEKILKKEIGVSPIQERNTRAQEENELLSKENQRLKDEMRDVYKRLQEMNIENLKLKADIKHQEESNRVMSAKLRSSDDIGTKSLTKDLKRENRELEIKALNEENKLLREKEFKYKQALREKDGLVSQLRVQYEEAVRGNQNDLYVSLVEKMKISKEKMTQMSRQIEDQKDVIVSKENAIENLLSRMDELSNSLTVKNSEINMLKNEVTSLKNEVKTIKEQQHQSEQKGVGSLYSKIREKERFMFSPEKKSEGLEQRVPSNNSRGNSPNSSDRKGPRLSPNAFKQSFEEQKGYFRPSMAKQDKKERIEDQINKSTQWSSLKWNMLNQIDKLDKTSKDKDQNLNKKLKNRSIDNFVQSKYESKPEVKQESKKSSQNIEDLQKRLAYLKHKRMEFEKKKSSGQDLKESGSSTTDLRKPYLTDSSTSFGLKTSLKNIDSLVSPTRNLGMGRYSEPLNEEDAKRRETLGKTGGPTSKIGGYKDSLVYKSIQLTQDSSEVDDAIKNLRTSLTSKNKIQPKLDNYVLNSTPSYQTEEDFKLGNRYHSFSNTTNQYNKAPADTSKGYKKSYDLSSYTKLHEVRNIAETTSTKNKFSGRDFFH